VEWMLQHVDHKKGGAGKAFATVQNGFSAFRWAVGNLLHAFPHIDT
jgi:hypothetical protein